MEQHAPQLLTDFLWIAGVAAVVVLLFQRLRIPDIIGLMITGVALGPTGFSLIRDSEGMRTTAELGVSLLLFTIGLEFSFAELKRLRRVAILGGTLQVVLTIAALSALAFFTWEWVDSSTLNGKQVLLMGILGAISSTTIVLRVLTARREVEAPHGQIALAILLWQDVAVIFLIWVVAFLGRGAGTETVASGGIVGGHPALALPILGVIVLLLRGLLPRLGNVFSEVRSREVFVLISLFLCFGAAKLTSFFGLSPALGAFMAGVIIAGTDVGSKVGEAVAPIRDALASLFFVSIGLLVDVRLGSVPVFLASAVGIIVVKTFIVVGICLLLHFPLRVAILAGLTISQIGEFSFVILSSARQSGLVPEGLYQNALVTIILTQMATPFIISRASWIADFVVNALRVQDQPQRAVRDAEPREVLRFDALIIGFGISGQRVWEQIRESNLRARIFEMNRTTVRQFAKEGVDIHYGDATDRRRLTQVGAAHAPFIVVTVSDSEAVARIVRHVRALNPAAKILARVRYRLFEEQARDAGADEVFVEEVETSARIAERLLALNSPPVGA